MSEVKKVLSVFGIKDGEYSNEDIMRLIIELTGKLGLVVWEENVEGYPDKCFDITADTQRDVEGE